MGLTALERFVRQWHAHQNLSGHLQELAEQGGTTEDKLRLSEWVLSLHDAQNAFRWGMQGQAKDKELLRDVYIGIESLRNSHDLISAHVADWVATKLSFRQASPGEEWKQQQRALWSALGQVPDVIDSL
eukprot:5543865-Lingulodinium_polyedra.AAC.1